MSRDRILKFKGPSPLLLEVQLATIEYLGSLVKQVDTRADASRFFIYLPGTFVQYGETERRLLEVVVVSTHIDVITRHMDGPTNDVADGVARHIARIFKGTYESSDFPKEPGQRIGYVYLELKDSPAMTEALTEIGEFSIDRGNDLCSREETKARADAFRTIAEILTDLQFVKSEEEADERQKA